MTVSQKLAESEEKVALLEASLSGVSYLAFWAEVDLRNRWARGGYSRGRGAGGGPGLFTINKKITILGSEGIS